MGKVVVVEKNEVLLTRVYVVALAVALCRLHLSRRKILDWLAEVIFEWLASGGRIVDENGHDLIIGPDTIDDVHGQDASLRVISSIMAYATKPRQRRPRVSLLSFLQIHDVAAKASGNPILPEARRAERGAMRDLLRGFSRVTRVRYLREVKRLRRDYQGDRRPYYAAAVHRLRHRFAAEQAAWQAANR